MTSVSLFPPSLSVLGPLHRLYSTASILPHVPSAVYVKRYTHHQTAPSTRMGETLGARDTTIRSRRVPWATSTALGTFRGQSEKCWQRFNGQCVTTVATTRMTEFRNCESLYFICVAFERLRYATMFCGTNHRSRHHHHHHQHHSARPTRRHYDQQ